MPPTIMVTVGSFGSLLVLAAFAPLPLLLELEPHAATPAARAAAPSTIVSLRLNMVGTPPLWVVMGYCCGWSGSPSPA